MAQFIAILFAFLFLAWGFQADKVDLLFSLEKTYARIDDVQVFIAINQIGAEGQEGRTVKVKLQALAGRAILRIEYLEPPELYGQILTLEGDELSQYLPTSHTIIKKKLAPEDIMTTLLRSVDLKTALKRLRSGDFSLKITRHVGGFFGDSGDIKLSISISKLALGAHTESLLHLSLLDYPFENMLLNRRLSDLAVEYLVLEIGSKTLPTQRLWLDPQSLFVRGLETQLFLKFGGKIRQIKIIADIESLRINQNLTRESLLLLPSDARIITIPR